MHLCLRFLSSRARSNVVSTRRFSTKNQIKIETLEVFKLALPLKEGSYNWSEGKSVSVFDSLVVAVRTNNPDIVGWGEFCPLGPTYLPAFVEGAQAGILHMAPHLIGQDPTQLMPINYLMDRTLKGHPYVKSAVDMACWDILGKVTGLPVATLLGGYHDYKLPLYRAISQQSPAEMASKVSGYKKEGYTKFQLKVGGNPDEDIERIRAVRAILDPTDRLVADANCGWLPHEAQRVVRAVADLDVYIEQPCPTYEDSLKIRKNTTHPFILDENIDGLTPLLKGYQDGAMDCINIKISKFGGLTHAKQARDLAVSMGLAMIIEDSWGGDIITAAIAHLAQSTPKRNLFAATDFNSYVTQSIATGAPVRVNGTMEASKAPGLGVVPRMDVLNRTDYYRKYSRSGTTSVLDK